jgi:hypothetical protein
VNPDFGQVEVDPAQINLSAFVVLPERRPLFTEGSDVFQFGKEQLYYSYGFEEFPAPRRQDSDEEIHHFSFGRSRDGPGYSRAVSPAAAR